VLPATISGYLASIKLAQRAAVDHPAFLDAEEKARSLTEKLLKTKGKRTVASFHKELGQILWDYCGMTRNEAGLLKALQLIPALRQEFWKNVQVPGGAGEVNQSLEQAGRVADFLELGELMCLDALERRESCGGHFREEFQEDGECKRDDARFAHVAAWEYAGLDKKPLRHTEPLIYEEIKMSTRSYK
jgi:succinate dehydrogenase / fumarate reductase flavoprotein subunit